MEAIKATGYTPNAMARSLRARSTKMVLALIPGMSNTFFTPILNAIEDTLWAAGYGMIIGDTGHTATNGPDYERRKEQHYLRLIRGGQVDGVILFTGRLPYDEASTLSPGQIPMALVCNEIPGEERISVFDVANRATAMAAVDYLVGRGHRRIAYLAGPPGNVESNARLIGYREALCAASIPYDDTLVWGESFRFQSGVVAAGRYLDMSERPSAVFSSADHAAIGFIKTVQQAGLRVPDDVSVMGFDDIDVAEMIEPPLTTMRQPREALGRAAARDLVQRMANGGGELPPTRLRLECALIERGSVRDATQSEKKSRKPARPPRTAAPAE
jgi:LacI family repressor for deo operon, udp, cdd, tsx, nupC, and nupG